MTEDELNRKMQEAEAYFRILTQQVKVKYKYYFIDDNNDNVY